MINYFDEVDFDYKYILENNNFPESVVEFGKRNKKNPNTEKHKIRNKSDETEKIISPNTENIQSPKMVKMVKIKNTNKSN